MYKIFFDTEFTGLHKNTTLISIGLVIENNDKFYAEFTDYDKNQIDNWLKDNIINKLLIPDPTIYSKGDLNWKSESLANGVKTVIGNTNYVKEALLYWLDQIYCKFGKMEFWSDCLAYDWVLFNDLLFKTALGIPGQKMYYIPFDISTLFKVNNIDPDIFRDDFAEISEDESSKFKHTALYDAEVIKMCYNKIMML